MSNMTEREQFEATFSAPPYEFRMERWGDRAAWAGNYKSYYVQCAWDGYQEARAVLAQPVAAEPEQDPDPFDDRKDAERYRWLRSRLPGAAYRIAGVIYSEGGAGVDAAIDAARSPNSSIEE